MAQQTELQGRRLQLLSVLWDRLAEMEDDEARQAALEATNWDLAAGDPCPRCKKPSLRFQQGVCLPCMADIVERADRQERLRQRYLRSMKAHNARVDKRNKRGPAYAGPPQQHSGPIGG